MEKAAEALKINVSRGTRKGERMRLIDADALSRDFCPGETYRAGEIQDVIDAAPTVEPVGNPNRLYGWISVKDQLPPSDDTKVLTYGNPVTHWMYLPEPPKEAEQ